MKDCTTCKYGYEDERLGIPMCHHPKRFLEDCIDFNMHEEKEIKEPEKPMQEELEEEIEKYLYEQFGEPWDGCHPVGVFELDSMARHFAKWGAEHAREQIMKEAVKGEIFDDYDKDICEHRLTILSTVPSGYKDGDKVRVIIVKED